MVAFNFECSFGFANTYQANAAASIDLGSYDGNQIEIIGTPVTVTSFGNTANQLRLVKWSSNCNITHSANLSLLQGEDRVNVSNGSLGLYVSDHEGKWSEIVFRTETGGTPGRSGWLRTTSYTANATWTKGANTEYVHVKVWAPGGGDSGTPGNAYFGTHAFAQGGVSHPGGSAANGSVNIVGGGTGGAVVTADPFVLAPSGGYSENIVNVSAISSVNVVVGAAASGGANGAVVVYEFA
jgi:hypothetical protein